MGKLGKEILEGLGGALANAKGRQSHVRVTVINIPDVKAIRETLHMTQSEFAEAYQIPLTTLQGWEQGRRSPDRTAAAYLNVIARLPVETRTALHA